MRSSASSRRKVRPGRAAQDGRAPMVPASTPAVSRAIVGQLASNSARSSSDRPGHGLDRRAGRWRSPLPRAPAPRSRNAATPPSGCRPGCRPPSKTPESTPAAMAMRPPSTSRRARPLSSSTLPAQASQRGTRSSSVGWPSRSAIALKAARGAPRQRSSSSVSGSGTSVTSVASSRKRYASWR